MINEEIIEDLNIMGRGTDSNIMDAGITNPAIIAVTGVHGENGMIIEDIIIVRMKKVGITDKTIVFISSLKLKTADLYSPLGDN